MNTEPFIALLTFGIVLTAGMLITGLLYNIIGNQMNNAILNSKILKPFFYITCLIGVPIHEMSHALMAILFRHQILEIKLLDFGLWKRTGTLGYVNHGYSTGSLFQQAGNFFIGIAPMLTGTGVCMAVSYMYTTGTIDLHNPYTIAMLIAGVAVIMHSGLSMEDLKGALIGAIFSCIVIAIVSYLLSQRIAPEQITWLYQVFLPEILKVFGIGLGINCGLWLLANIIP